MRGCCVGLLSHGLVVFSRQAAHGSSDDTASAAKRALDELRQIMAKNKERMSVLTKRFAQGPRGGPEESEEVGRVTFLLACAVQFIFELLCVLLPCDLPMLN